MNNESIDLMHQKTQKMIIQWQQKITTNRKLKQNFYTNGLAISGSEVIGPKCCDEELRERYRI